MDRVAPEHAAPSHQQKRVLNIGFYVALVALWAKHASQRVSKKLKPTKTFKTAPHRLVDEEEDTWSPRSVPRSPLRTIPKEILTSIGNKTMTLVNQRKRQNGGGGGGAPASEEEEDTCTWSPRSVPRSPLRAIPKEILTSIGNKTMTLVNRRKRRDGGGAPAVEEDDEEYGVWQRTILMGGKCQPLDFSGVIYYDSEGRQLKEVPPRSPRASPLPPYLHRNI